MSTQGSLAGLATFDKLNSGYEDAYQDNDIKKSCIVKAISLLPEGSRVLDVGCGTGVPVSDMLSKAGLEVVGFDISPKMVSLAKERIPGTFTVSDMLEYPIKEDTSFAGVLIIYSQLQLSYLDFHSAAYKFAQALQPGGFFVIGQSPSDTYVQDDSGEYDETKTYVEGFNLPFMGEPCATLMLSEEGQKEFLRSMGLEVVWEVVGIFQPRSERAGPERQQYVIARRPADGKALMPPKPLPKDMKLCG